MYIIDGIAYAGELAKPVKFVSACPLDGWRLKLRFSTGEVKIFDCEATGLIPLRLRRYLLKSLIINTPPLGAG